MGKHINHQDYLKVVQLRRWLYYMAATATLEADLTAESQSGWDTTLKRLKLFDGSTVQTLMYLTDVLNDNSLGGGSPSSTKTASQASIKAFIENALSGIATGLKPYPSLFDASAETTFPADYEAGDWYKVSAAGTVLGVKLEIGDTIYPVVASPDESDTADWFVAQSNVDEATNTVFGFLKVATLSELQNNTAGAENKAITVEVLNDYFDARPITRTYVETVNLVNGTVGVTHNLNSTNLHVTMTDSGGMVHGDWAPSGSNAINIPSLAAVSSVKVVITATY